MEKSTRGDVLAVLVSVFFTVAEAAGNTISVGRSINPTESLVSAEGTFKLGFFSPGNSRRRYLGIWFNRVTPLTVVWVANPRRPLPAASCGVLTMAENGSLLLTDTGGAAYWFSEVSGAVRSPVARLGDNGNLVVDAYGGDTGSYAWQSFDHPTDTMLAGMKLGYDARTGLSRNLTAWRTADDPAPASYTAVIDIRGVPQGFLLNGSKPLFRAGPWVGRQFTGTASTDSQNYSYSFVVRPDGVFYKFYAWDSSILFRLVVTPSGIIQSFRWINSTGEWMETWRVPWDQCDLFNMCGPNGVCHGSAAPASCTCLPGFKPRRPQEWERGVTTGGCAREVDLECRSGQEEFSTVKGAKLPDTSVAAVVMGVGLDDCRERCLRNCSCTAFTNSDGSGCITWFGDLVDIRVYWPPDTRRYPFGAGQDLYVRRTGSTRKKEVMIVITVPTIVVVMLLLLGATRKRLLDTQISIGKYIQDTELPAVNFSNILSATNNFSSENKIGEGGFGAVYKGKLGGEEIAVKRLSKHSVQGLEEFKSEIQLVAKLQHVNLVKLLGYCAELEEKILIYEFMPNQSLDKFIFDPEGGRALDWRKRFQIINGIAQGLLYLHQYSRLKVIHRDLKASNILLDEEWNPKISDFGLAKILAWNDCQSNTNRIVGTYGYMSPEYAIMGRFSVKSDVFSFGVILLEILSGKKSTSVNHFGHSSNLLEHAWDLWREDRELELMDPTMVSTSPPYEVTRCVQVALLCVQERPVDRPTMLDVVSMLNNEHGEIQKPNPPAFFLGRNMTDGLPHELLTLNDVTISVLVAR